MSHRWEANPITLASQRRFPGRVTPPRGQGNLSDSMRAARRGAYRIVCRVDDGTQLVEILHTSPRVHVHRS